MNRAAVKRRPGGRGILRATPMPIPTEPIGSIPRPLELIEAVAAKDGDGSRA